MDFQAIYNEAHSAGLQAGNAHQPTPMIVQQHSNMLNDNSPVVQQWHVAGGVCGFAWVNVRPANSAFGRWLKRTGKVRNVAYKGGYNIWCSNFGQSMECKAKYAHAFAEVLNKYGIKAYSDSRID